MVWLWLPGKIWATEIPVKKYSFCVSITDSVTHQPLEAVSISIPEMRMQQVTDANGLLCQTAVSVGWYTIRCSFVGYHAVSVRYRISGNDTLHMVLCPESYHLHEVMISDDKPKQDKSYSIQHKQVLEINQIQERNGQNITELLSTINGVNTLTSGPHIQKPVLRGLHSQRLVMMMGSTKMEGQQWGAEHAPEIDPFAVGRVEVIKGASSVEFGAEAIGGVIRLMPRLYRQSNGINGEFSLNGFSNNRQGATAIQLFGAHLNRFRWKAQMSARKAGDSRTADYIISNTAFRELNASSSFQYTVSEKIIAELSYSTFATTIGIFSGAHMGNVDDLMQAIKRPRPLVIQPFTYQINRPYQEVSHEIISGKWIYKLGKASTLQYQYARQDNRRKEFDSDQPYNQTLRALNLPAFYLQIISQSHELKWEHQSGSHWSGKTGIQYTLQNNITSGLQFLIPDFIAHSVGAFAIEKLEYEKWSAEMGVRFDWRKMDVSYRDRFRSFEKSLQFSMPTAIISISRKLPLNFVLIGTLSSGWRAPAINELYSNGLHMGTATYEIGNDQLQSEISYTADMTVKKQTEQSTFEISVYNNYLYNFIYQLPDLQPTLTVRGAFPTMRFVQTDANLSGFDVSYQINMWKSYYGGAAYSFLYAMDVKQEAPLIFMPANRTRLNVGYRADKVGKLTNTFLEWSAAIIERQYRFVSNLDYADPPPAYFTVNINMGFDVKIQKQTIRMSFGINNIFNTAYRDYLSRFRYFTDDTGRNFILRLTIPFNILNKP